MSLWSIEFVIEDVRSNERINYKRELTKEETIVNLEIEDVDLIMILKCNSSSLKFSYKELFDEDKKNILKKDEIKEEMIKEYFVSNYKLDFTNRTGRIRLSYPKVNLL